MHGPARRAVRVVGRTVLWPWRRVRRYRDRWRRGGIYGWRRPSWWPQRLVAWPGHGSPHQDKSVVIFVGAVRYEFAPAVQGPYEGHVFAGRLRPDAADIAGRLARLGLPGDGARALAAVSSCEGGFDSIQTYDRAKFCWGFIQFAATGGLPRLLDELKTIHPEVFASHFAPAGIDVAGDLIVVRRGGRTLRGRAAHGALHDDPSLWMPFVRAAQLSDVQDVQVLNAHKYYYAHPLNAVVPIGPGRPVTLAALFADSELARAVVCDRAVNRGVGHAAVLFRDAVQRVRATGPDDVDRVLEYVWSSEAVDAGRLDSLARQMGASGRR